MAETVAREEQLRLDLTADVAHELRTPVAVLQAGHEALLDGIVEPTPEQLSSLRDEVLRLARLVEDLHGLAAAEAGGLRLNPEPHNLAGVAAAAADSLGPQIAAGALTLTRLLRPTPVTGDARWMHQVVTNLLGNAIKFTPAGGRIDITVEPVGQTACLRVSDTGPGIPADEQPHVFDRFWRGRASASIPGSGTGLAVVAALVRAHGGDVAITSGPSSGPYSGTTVAVSLPLLTDRPVDRLTG